jgi:uncharacterized protein (TIGR02217 family)
VSDNFLPALKGLKWDIGKSPRFNNKVQSAVDLTEARAAFAAMPMWDFRFSYEVLRQSVAQGTQPAFTELSQLCGFFMARLGSWDSFLYEDPYDSTATLEPIGFGDGAATGFDLQRAFGPFQERVSNFANASIYSNGVVVGSGYSINTANGRVTFNTPPASGANLTWSGRYYFRCRFKEDVTEFSQFNAKLWEAKTFEFVGNLGTKLK